MDRDTDPRVALLREMLEEGILTEEIYLAKVAALDTAASPPPAPDRPADSTTPADRAVTSDETEGSIVTGDNNSVTHITTIYQNAPGAPALGDDAFQAALGRYLHWVEQRYGRLDLRGVEPREQSALSLTLDDVYVSLLASVAPKRLDRFRQRPEEMEEREVKPVDMGELLALGNRLIITGGPGSGKTTFLRLIAATLARAIRLNEPQTVQEALGLAEPLPLPIFISLSDFNRYRRTFNQSDDPRMGTLMAFISHDLIHQQAIRGLPPDFFERLLDGGQGVMLLLDGLDEVADERERVLVSRAVENLAFNDGVGHVIVTSRTRAYQGDAALAEAFRLAHVQPMSPEQVDALADRWCHAVYIDETTAATESGRLRDAIHALEKRRKDRGEPPLADSPLIVTIIAIVHYNEHRLPEQRAELYGKCVDILLAEKHHHQVTEAHYELVDRGGKPTEKRKWLAYLAYRMMDAGSDAGRTVDERTLNDWLRPRLATRVSEAEAEEQLEAFCTAMRERGSLLAERGGQYQFTHLTFQEYLCATYLADVVSDTEKIVAYLLEDGRLADAWWRETILLVAGYLGLRSDEQALALLHQLAAVDTDDAVALAATELAAAAFLEMEGQDEPTQAVIVDRLVALLSDPALEAPPALRMLGGDALGRLGDPRPGVLSLEPDLIPIPSGPFLMGDNRDEVVIDQPYAIARYPVTNAQFRFFVEDGGYTERWRHCWTEAGWKEKVKSNWTEPRWWDSDRFNLPNQPVAGASWYEGVAYAAWLRETTGKPYRLPTEAEWERAAAHTDTRKFPWGKEWREGLANSEEAELGRATAVGVFPDGNAHCGAADLAGNVDEWCQTRWAYDLPYHSDDGREDLSGGNSIERVLRGGTWSDGDKWLRCAYRSWNHPYDRRDRYGFRVVVSPFLTANL